MDMVHDSRARMLAFCVFVVLLVTGAGFGFDRVLLREGATRLDIMLLSNGLTGLVAGGLFFQLGRYERERRKVVRARLRVIAEMNHHIRNALQIITYVASSQQQEDSVELIRNSVERIEWSLREVLPGYAGAPSEVPAEEQRSAARVK